MLHRDQVVHLLSQVLLIRCTSGVCLYCPRIFQGVHVPANLPQGQTVQCSGKQKKNKNKRKAKTKQENYTSESTGLSKLNSKVHDSAIRIKLSKWFIWKSCLFSLKNCSMVQICKSASEQTISGNKTLLELWPWTDETTLDILGHNALC